MYEFFLFLFYFFLQLDLPLSPVLYKWLLKEENSLHLADLSDIDVGLFKSLQYLCGQLLKSQCGDKEVKKIFLLIFN